ncbi:hypothetical protein DYB25_007064 [Aphanomyces astaci]|nr:hypothetical protein DYB25_007064 [Aphanomyces astaci]RHY42386.1 hypothetical protein DYB34_000838 [Aphanomyces astaci]RHY62524.1 hypothetical protein DYB30_005054 [Aphanomyces astaci]
MLSNVQWNEAQAFWLVTAIAVSPQYQLMELYRPGVPLLNLRFYQYLIHAAHAIPVTDDMLVRLQDDYEREFPGTLGPLRCPTTEAKSTPKQPSRVVNGRASLLPSLVTALSFSSGIVDAPNADDEALDIDCNLS